MATSSTERIKMLTFSSLQPQKSMAPISQFQEIIVESSLKLQMNKLSEYFSQFNTKIRATEGVGTCLVISSDNKTIYYGTEEGRLIGFNYITKEVFLDKNLKNGAIKCLSASNSSDELIIGVENGLLIIYNLTKETISDKLLAHKGGINGIVLSNSNFYTVGADKNVIMWELDCLHDPQILYSHKREILAIDISDDNTFLATGGKDCAVLLYDIKSRSNNESITGFNLGAIFCLKFIQRCNFIAAGDEQGKILVFDYILMRLVYDLKGHIKRINCLEVSEKDSSLISAGNDGKIFIWNFSGEKSKSIEVTDRKKAIQSIKHFKNSNMFCSISKDKLFKTWGIPNFNHYYIIDLNIKSSNYSEALLGYYDKESFYLLNNKEILRINRTNETQRSFNLDQYKMKIIALDNLNEIFCIAHCDQINENKLQNHNFSFFSLITFNPIKSRSIICHGLYSMIFSADGSLLVLGEKNRCVVLNTSTFEIVHRFNFNKTPIELLSISKDCQYLISSGRQTMNIKLYNLNLGSLVDIYEDSSFSHIKKIIFSNDEDFFIVLPQSDNITVWTTVKKIKIYTYENKGILDIRFYQLSDQLYLLKKRSIESLEFPSFTKTFILNFNERVYSFGYNQDLSEIIVMFESRAEIWQTPANLKFISCFGNDKRLYKYCKYLGKLFSGKIKHNSGKFDDWIIEPVHMNTSHIYAYLNRIDLLKHAIASGFGFVNSVTNFTPLDICLEMNNEKGIQEYFNYLKEGSKLQPNLTSLLDTSVNKLIMHESSTTKEILDLILLKTLDTDFPQYSNTDLPIINFYPNFFRSEVSDIHLQSKRIGKKVEYLQSYFKLNLKIGSNDSLNFLRSLFSTKNEATYKTRFVQTILDYKWARVRIILIIQSIVFTLYLILFSLYAILDDNRLLSSAFVLNIILILYEVVQLIVSPADYIKDAWNLIDVTRCVMMTWVFARSVSSLNSQNNIMAFVVFVSWVRGIAYFRIISYTRYYIRLIHHVIYDIIPFITIFLYSTLAFSIILVKISDTSHSYTYVLAKCWEMNLTSFNGQDYSGYVYLAFAFYMMFNPIIMLTLLVSIMSHTFDRLNENVVVAEGYALCKMIIEAELLCFWKRKLSQKTYLHVCRKVVSEFDDDDNGFEQVNEKVKFAIERVDEMNKDLNQKIENLSFQIVDVRKNQDEIKSYLKKLVGVNESDSVPEEPEPAVLGANETRF